MQVLFLFKVYIFLGEKKSHKIYISIINSIQLMEIFNLDLLTQKSCRHISFSEDRQYRRPKAIPNFLLLEKQKRKENGGYIYMSIVRLMQSRDAYYIKMHEKRKVYQDFIHRYSFLYVQAIHIFRNKYKKVVVHRNGNNGCQWSLFQRTS